MRVEAIGGASAAASTSKAASMLGLKVGAPQGLAVDLTRGGSRLLAHFLVALQQCLSREGERAWSDAAFRAELWAAVDRGELPQATVHGSQLTTNGQAAAAAEQRWSNRTGSAATVSPLLPQGPAPPRPGGQARTKSTFKVVEVKGRDQLEPDPTDDRAAGADESISTNLDDDDDLDDDASVHSAGSGDKGGGGGGGGSISGLAPLPVPRIVIACDIDRVSITVSCRGSAIAHFLRRVCLHGCLQSLLTNLPCFLPPVYQHF